MKEQPYAVYLDSGSDWLGKIPEHWDILRLRRVFDIFHGSTPKTSEASFWDGDIPWATPEDLGKTETDTLYKTGRTITKEGYDSCGTILAPPGSIIVSTRAPVGHIKITGVETCTNQGCHSLVFRDGGNSRYYYYLLLAGRQELESRAQGTTFSELSTSKLENIRILKPPQSEQDVIAVFLDRRITAIDAIAADKAQQIELLQEKRNTLINHAVTKGLNDDTPMKDSGIEWLGRIPENWSVVRCKTLFKENKERSESGEGELLTVSHISGVTPRSEKNVTMFMAETLEDYKKCKAGDLIINTMWAWMGALGIAFQDGIVSPSYNVYRLRQSGFDPRYYDRLFRTRRFLDEINRFSKGVWKSRLRLYPSEFFQIRIPCPPEDEQKAIADFIDKKASEVDELVTNIHKSIRILKEYRQALISVAVTGKIDLRGEVS